MNDAFRATEGSGASETTFGTAAPCAGSAHRRASSRTRLPFGAERCGSGRRRDHGRAIRRAARGESADAASTEEGWAVERSGKSPGSLEGARPLLRVIAALGPGCVGTLPHLLVHDTILQRK